MSRGFGPGWKRFSELFEPLLTSWISGKSFFMPSFFLFLFGCCTFINFLEFQPKVFSASCEIQTSGWRCLEMPKEQSQLRCNTNTRILFKINKMGQTQEVKTRLGQKRVFLSGFAFWRGKQQIATPWIRIHQASKMLLAFVLTLVIYLRETKRMGLMVWKKNIIRRLHPRKHKGLLLTNRLLNCQCSSRQNF